MAYNYLFCELCQRVVSKCHASQKPHIAKHHYKKHHPAEYAEIREAQERVNELKRKYQYQGF